MKSISDPRGNAMNLRPRQSAPLRWLLAALLPVAVASVEYLWLEATTSGPGCTSGPGAPTLPSLGLLAFMAPWAIATYVWAATGSLRRAWAPMLVTIVLVVPLAVFVWFVWAAGHQCFE
jgi:hypothetical protein